MTVGLSRTVLVEDRAVALSGVQPWRIGRVRLVERRVPDVVLQENRIIAGVLEVLGEHRDRRLREPGVPGCESRLMHTERRFS